MVRPPFRDRKIAFAAFSRRVGLKVVRFAPATLWTGRMVGRGKSWRAQSHCLLVGVFELCSHSHDVWCLCCSCRGFVLEMREGTGRRLVFSPGDRGGQVAVVVWLWWWCLGLLAGWRGRENGDCYMTCGRYWSWQNAQVGQAAALGSGSAALRPDLWAHDSIGGSV